MEDFVERSLARQDIVAERILTTPAPFNSLLWRIVVMEADGYYEGFRSVFDKNPDVPLTRYSSDLKLLRGIERHWPVQRLQWFTHGFYAIARKDSYVVITDLRMGLEPDYVFSFKVGRISNPHTFPMVSEHIAGEREISRLRWVWERIWSESAGIEHDSELPAG